MDWTQMAQQQHEGRQYNGTRSCIIFILCVEWLILVSYWWAQTGVEMFLGLPFFFWFYSLFFFFFREGWKTSLTFQSISIRIFLFWVTEWILKSPLDVKIIRLVSIRYCTWLQNDKMELAHFSSQLLKSVSMFDVNISKQFEDTFWHHAMGLAESFDPERSSSTIRTSWLVRYRRRCLKKKFKKNAHTKNYNGTC